MSEIFWTIIVKNIVEIYFKIVKLFHILSRDHDHSPKLNDVIDEACSTMVKNDQPVSSDTHSSTHSFANKQVQVPSSFFDLVNMRSLSLAFGVAVLAWNEVGAFALQTSSRSSMTCMNAEKNGNQQYRNVATEVGIIRPDGEIIRMVNQQALPIR